MTTSTCKSCGASIIWATSSGSGKPIPLNAMPVAKVITLMQPDEPVAYFVDSYVSHFATCPHADQWRRERRGSSPEAVSATREEVS